LERLEYSFAATSCVESADTDDAAVIAYTSAIRYKCAVSRIHKKPPPGRFWFDVVLDFANASDLEAAARRLSADDSVWLSTSDETKKKWQLRFPEDWEGTDLKSQQLEMRTLLDKLRTKGVTRSLWGQIVMAASSPPVLPVSGFVMFFADRPSDFLPLAAITPRNVGQWYGFAIAELLAQGLGEKLRACALRSCGKYFVDASSRGHERYYCSQSHASQDRVAAKRANMSIDAWRNRR
jgi:hypothetical protein